MTGDHVFDFCTIITKDTPTVTLHDTIAPSRAGSHPLQAHSVHARLQSPSLLASLHGHEAAAGQSQDSWEKPTQCAKQKLNAYPQSSAESEIVGAE